MTSCALCLRHRPDADGGCTESCRHVEPTVGQVCARCHLRVLDQLDTIAEAIALDAPVEQHGSKVRAAFGSKPPTSTAWLDWTRGDELRGCLGSWARAIHEDDPDLDWPVTTAAGLCAWLRLRWHDRLPWHEAVAEFAAEIEVWAREARRVLGRRPVGEVITCPGCEARLRVDIVGDPDGTVACRRCGQTGTAAWLMRLASAEGWADSEALAVGYGVSERSLRRWARHGEVKAKGTRPRLYAIADVLARINE